MQQFSSSLLLHSNNLSCSLSQGVISLTTFFRCYCRWESWVVEFAFFILYTRTRTYVLIYTHSSWRLHFSSFSGIFEYHVVNTSFLKYTILKHTNKSKFLGSYITFIYYVLFVQEQILKLLGLLEILNFYWG